MNDKSKKQGRVGLGLNCISIEFPNEILSNTCRSNQKTYIRPEERPQSANVTSVIHSVPQYWANVVTNKKPLATQSNFSQVKTSRSIKIHENYPKFQESTQNYFRFLKQKANMSAATLKIKSLKIEQLGLNTDFCVNKHKKIPEGHLSGEAEKNREFFKKTGKKLEIFKNKSEIKLKNKLIEISDLEFPRNKKMAKGKIIRNNFTYRYTDDHKKNIKDLLIVNSKK